MAFVVGLAVAAILAVFCCCGNGVALLAMLRLADCCVCCCVWLLMIWMWPFLQLCWLGGKSSTVDQCRYDSFFAVKMVYLYPCVVLFLLCLSTVVTNIKEQAIFNVLYTTVMQ